MKNSIYLLITQKRDKESFSLFDYLGTNIRRATRDQKLYKKLHSKKRLMVKGIYKYILLEAKKKICRIRKKKCIDLCLQLFKKHSINLHDLY